MFAWAVILEYVIIRDTLIIRISGIFRVRSVQRQPFMGWMILAILFGGFGRHDRTPKTHRYW